MSIVIHLTVKLTSYLRNNGCMSTKNTTHFFSRSNLMLMLVNHDIIVEKKSFCKFSTTLITNTQRTWKMRNYFCNGSISLWYLMHRCVSGQSLWIMCLRRESAKKFKYYNLAPRMSETVCGFRLKWIAMSFFFIGR